MLILVIKPLLIYIVYVQYLSIIIMWLSDQYYHQHFMVNLTIL